MGSALTYNLRRLRDAKRLTQAQVAERAGLSRVAYVNIESGADPKVATLMRIAEVLGVRLEALVEPRQELKHVRFRARKRMTSREQLLSDVGRWLRDYSELEELLGDRVEYRLGRVAANLSKKRPGPERAREAAKQVRNALALAEGERIRDLCGLLEERAGVKLGQVRLASDTFFGLSIGKEDGGPAIVVNTWERISVERWIFTAAHELGHLLLHFGAYDTESTDENADEEKEADQFASHLLMPDSVFQGEWKATWGLGLVDRVLKVKHIFDVSYRTVLYRLYESPTYGSSIWAHFKAAYRNQFGETLLKADEPERLGPDRFHASMVESRAADEPRRIGPEHFVDDRQRRLVRRAVERELISLGRAAEILSIDHMQMRKLAASWVE
jgi:Zn-dependent peptidase ImmA (M78 family)/DNA-binding XRE family transcriptional regulator